MKANNGSECNGNRLKTLEMAIKAETDLDKLFEYEKELSQK